jgi:hypothetical protein
MKYDDDAMVAAAAAVMVGLNGRQLVAPTYRQFFETLFQNIL